MNIIESLKTVYPNIVDCVDGHIGTSIITEEFEQDDDRCWLIKVRRCSHCHMVISEE